MKYFEGNDYIALAKPILGLLLALPAYERLHFIIFKNGT